MRLLIDFTSIKAVICFFVYPSMIFSETYLRAGWLWARRVIIAVATARLPTRPVNMSSIIMIRDTTESCVVMPVERPTVPIPESVFKQRIRQSQALRADDKRADKGQKQINARACGSPVNKRFIKPSLVNIHILAVFLRVQKR